MGKEELSGKKALESMMAKAGIEGVPFPRRVFVPIRSDGDPHRSQTASMICEEGFLIRASTGTWVMTRGVKDVGWFLRYTYAAALMGVFFPGRFESSDEARNDLVRDAAVGLSGSYEFQNAVLIAMCDRRLVWPMNPPDPMRSLLRRFRGAIEACARDDRSFDRDLHDVDNQRSTERDVSYDPRIVSDLARLLIEALRAT